MRLSKGQVWAVWDSDRKKSRKGIIIAVIVVVVLFILCNFVKYNAYAYDEKFVPLQYLKSYWLGIKMVWASIFDPELYAQKDNLINEIGSVYYLGAFGRLRITVMSFLAGAGLAIAGAIFQTIYKNPMASPNMLGATAGVKLGNMLMITLYSTQALVLVTRRYIYCYALTAACVIAVLLLGKLAGRGSKEVSVMQMVMAGSVISQGLNVFTMYYMYKLEDEDLELYQELSMGTGLTYDTFSLVIFLCVIGAAIIPMILLRYRFNAVALEDSEVRTSGVNPAPIRIISQICGVVMVTAAMIHCGDAGMISMLIPFAVRNKIGSESRKVLFYSAAAGGVLIMLARLVTSSVLLFDEEMPAAFILNIFLTPLFMVVLAKQKREVD